MTTPKGPFRLITVNTAPERAQRLIGRVADTLKDQYIIIHEANCSSMFPLSRVSCRCRKYSKLCVLTATEIEEVGPKVQELLPDVLVSCYRDIYKSDLHANDFNSSAHPCGPQKKPSRFTPQRVR